MAPISPRRLAPDPIDLLLSTLIGLCADIGVAWGMEGIRAQSVEQNTVDLVRVAFVSILELHATDDWLLIQSGAFAYLQLAATDDW